MNTLKLGDSGDNVKLLQEKLGINNDGKFGADTETKVKEFQKAHGLLADGIAGKDTLTKLGLNSDQSLNTPASPSTNSKKITESQYIEAAKLIGCEVAAIKAVDTVESSGDGFLANGDVKILFEPHIFWKQLIDANIDPNKYVHGNEDILYSKWKSGAYGPVTNQWNRMNRAIAINREAALKAASYGKFQIMGFNMKACGFNDIESFVTAMKINEYEHLKAFIGFVKSNRLDKYLISKDWASFAKSYNGASYKENQYDTKLAQAYNKNK